MALSFCKAIAGIGLAACIATQSFGIVPATYKGKPYGGRPYAIPGRINFSSYDLGGINVAWKCDNQAGAYGSSAGPRANDGETQHPGFYATNSNPADPPDKYTDGTVYPSADNPTGSWYIGAAHATDWVGVTVKVAKAGTYWIHTIAASDPADIKFNITFNDVNKIGTITLPGSGGYHTWKRYNNIAKIALDTGTQVMKFVLVEAHMNYEFVNFTTDSIKATGVESLPSIGQAGLVRLAAGGNAISLFTPQSGIADIAIVDCAGRTVMNVVKNGMLSAGSHKIAADLSRVGHGVYFIRFLQNGNQKVVPLVQVR
jgi:hypothetical protein